MSDCCRLVHIVTIATHNLILSNECTSSIKIAHAFILSKNSLFCINRKLFRVVVKTLFFAAISQQL